MDKNINRRRFIRNATLTTIGSAALLSPIGSLAQPAAGRFKRIKPGEFFFVNDSPGVNFFIYTDDKFKDDEFLIPKAFDPGFTIKFVIVFFSDRVEFNGTLDNFCNDNLQGKKFLWLDKTKLDKSASILFVDNTLSLPLDVSFSNQQNKPDINFELSQGGNALVGFNPASNSFIITAGKGIFTFSANGQSALTNQFEITLSHTARAFDTPTQVKNNGGSLRFKTTSFNKTGNAITPIKPYSPYLMDGNGNFSLLKVDYFEDASYEKSLDLLVTLFPYRDFTNESPIVSFMELVPKANSAPVLLHMADQFGKRYVAKDFSSFLCRMAIYKMTGKIDNFYLFIPYNKLTLHSQGENPKSELLLGYSGTERILNESKSLEIVFVTSKKIKADKNLDKLEEHQGSLTSRIWFLPKGYCIDAEKSPLFNNAPTKDKDNRQIAYEAIKTGQLGDTIRIADNNRHYFAELVAREHLAKELDTIAQPIIPFFAFQKTGSATSASLKKLETVFTKLRLESVAKPEPPTRNYVTPQGFIKDKNNFIYLNEKPNLKPSIVQENANRRHQTLEFSIRNIDPDFNISMSREEVFFVTSPRLIRQSLSKIELDIFFSMAGFDVDLILKPGEGTVPEKEKIIIFKYSKSSLSDLVKDTSSWSNWNSYNKKDTLNTLQRTIQDRLDDFSSLFEEGKKRGKNKQDNDYFYIDQVIARDKNWNGVLMLDIPLTDPNHLPPVFTGLTASQTLQNVKQGNRLRLKTGLKFQYAAFPVNKTFVNNGKIEIESTVLYGLIDYDLFIGDKDSTDYKEVKKYLETDAKNENDDKWKFIMSKLLVRFENNEIRNFISYVFLKIENLFEDITGGDNFVEKLENDILIPDNTVRRLIKLAGGYHKNSNGQGTFNFSANAKTVIKLIDNNVLERLEIDKIGFGWSSENKFSFDIDAAVFFSAKVGTITNLLSFQNLRFGNIGLQFDLKGFELPKINFDLSRLFVLPTINFDGDGFLSSFPLKFKTFRAFRINADLNIPDYDFFDFPGFSLKNGNCSLWSMIFDFDLGTLGDLDFLKGLKAKLLVGWTKGGGFKLGFKIDGSDKKGIHINLFGALKIDIDQLDICNVGDKYAIRLINGRLTIISIQIPNKNHVFSGLIFANPGNKTAWLGSYVEKKGDKQLLSLGIGQRVGLPGGIEGIRTVAPAIEKLKGIFDPDKYKCDTGFPDVYQPSYNWTVASENIIPDSLKNIIDLAFIFNDPVLYGICIKIINYFKVDILYKRLSDDLGMWSLEFELDPMIRTIDAGAMVITLPNLGIDISTNGDWKFDIGFPKVNDWSRSCLIQLRPFVGWGGFYISRLKTASLSLFAPQYTTCVENTTIVQAGFAIRVGIGAYIDKGAFYVGASISVYGILEGAFAFNKGERGALKKLFPDHFALAGRVGAIAELVGYVDFKIIRASIYIVLRVEVGLTLVMIKSEGLQPVPLYIEGEVTVSIEVTIACFSIFRKKICIKIRLSFHAYVRFTYQLGGDPVNCNRFIERPIPDIIQVTDPIELPVILVPSFTRVKEVPEMGNHLICHFAIPLFGVDFKDNKGAPVLHFSQHNILKDVILLPLYRAIFSALGTNGSMKYTDLRDTLRGRLEGSTIDFKFPEYRPTFLLGFERPDVLNPEYRQFLNQHFKLTDEEVNLYFQHADPDNLYRIIPVPISSKINVVLPGKEATAITGFNVAFNGMTDTKIDPVRILPDKTFSKERLDQIQKELNKSYKTQFDTKPHVFKEDNYDLREDLIIPEYFCLLGLLALERWYNFVHEDEKNRNVNNFDPMVKVEDVLNNAVADPSNKTNWIFNNNIEEIIAYLNYLFNNGIRYKDKDDVYKSYFSLLRQTSSFAGTLSPENFAEAQVALFSEEKKDDGTPVHMFEMKNELFPTREIFKDFIKQGNDLLKDITFTSQFETPEFNAPYELVDVKLAVQNSRIFTEGKRTGFFAIPAKIGSHFSEGKYVPDLRSVKPSTKDSVLHQDPSAEKVSHTVCTNIELTVKPILLDDNEKTVIALEFSSVDIEELILVNKVYDVKEELLIKNILLYTVEENEKENEIILKSIPATGLSLVKTNLSPRTYPPVILKSFREKDPADADIFCADISNKKNFLRLLREGMTTNNGGYFLVSKQDGAFKHIPKGNFRIAISLETTDGKMAAVHGFNNYFKIDNTNLPNNTTLFDSLKNNTLALYTAVLRDIKEPNGDFSTQVKEYHPSIPVHCVSFRVKRKTDKELDPHLHYLPIDFNITDAQNKIVLSKDVVLPIMPATIKEAGDNGKLSYSHVTPLISTTVESNLSRYAAVGSSYTFDFSLRDIYGFRTCSLPDLTSKYKHQYFDKLIPISSWPFIKCSYWCKVENNNPSWFIECRINGNSKLIDTKESKESVMQSLYTIKAQLEDNNVKIAIADEVDSKDLPDTDKGELVKIVDSALEYCKSMKEKEELVTIKFKIALKGLKTELNPALVIRRHGPDDLFHPVPDQLIPGAVWDYDAVKLVKTNLLLTNTHTKDDAGDKETRVSNNLKALNELLKPTGFIIGAGIASDNMEKVPFLIQKNLIEPLFNDITLTPEKNFFGIRPYSTSLWSGNYNDHNFSNIDLDQALRTVLVKIDQLLEPAEIDRLNKADALALNKLIKCKKELVSGSGALKTNDPKKDKQLKGELADKVENLQKILKTDVPEWEYALLNKLNNFYHYDGILRTELSLKKELSSHRFTLRTNLKVTETVKENNYQGISSKLHYQDTTPPVWTLLFDNVRNNKLNETVDNYNFKIESEVTHIEYDIKQSTGEEIENSRWIQLLETLPLKAIPVVNFPMIIRTYPPEPAITLNTTRQVTDERNGGKWSSNLGKWHYLLGIKNDSLFGENDKIHIKLRLKSLQHVNNFAPDDFRNFEGFIAFWSAKEIKDDYAQFIDQLSKELAKKVQPAKPEITEQDKIEDIVLQKIGGAWKLKKNSNNNIFLIATGARTNPQERLRLDATIPNIGQLIFAGPNVFPDLKNPNKGSIVSVKPEIWVTRNDDKDKIANTHFKYSTTVITPSTWTTVHLRYLGAIDADPSLQSVYDTVIGKDKKALLPFKSTVKFLLNANDDRQVLNKDRNLSLPALPIQQLEFLKGAVVPAAIDNLFKGYENGYSAVSLTIYNDEASGAENDLPVFFCDTVFKNQQ